MTNRYIYVTLNMGLTCSVLGKHCRPTFLSYCSFHMLLETCMRHSCSVLGQRCNFPSVNVTTQLVMDYDYPT